MNAGARKLVREMKQSYDMGDKEEFDRNRTKTINYLREQNLWDEDALPDMPGISEEQQAVFGLSNLGWKKFYGLTDDDIRRELEAAKEEPRKRSDTKIVA